MENTNVSKIKRDKRSEKLQLLRSQSRDEAVLMSITEKDDELIAR